MTYIFLRGQFANDFCLAQVPSGREAEAEKILGIWPHAEIWDDEKAQRTIKSEQILCRQGGEHWGSIEVDFDALVERARWAQEDAQGGEAETGRQ